MNILNNNDTASMSYVTMDKNKLIEILKENKDKHDAIFDAALEGYWEAAKVKIEEKKKEFSSFFAETQKDIEFQFSKFLEKLDSKIPLSNTASVALKFNVNQFLGIIYPENHSTDYEKAIRKLELSIFDKVTLSEEEYERYVLNNWEWRNSFLASNTSYINSAVPAGNFPPKNSKYGQEFLRKVSQDKSEF